MLIKENNNTRQIPNAVATANSKILAADKRISDKACIYTTHIHHNKYYILYKEIDLKKNLD